MLNSTRVCSVIAAMGLAATFAQAQCTAGWVPGIGGQSNSGTVFATTQLSNGDILVGGQFNSIGGLTTANRIARYTPLGGIWTSTNVGINVGTFVMSLASLPGGDVMVGGQFSQAGGIPASNIVRMNLASGQWFAVGAGTNGLVTSLVVLPGGDVVAGGSFGTAGGQNVQCLARCNPTTGVWSAIESSASVSLIQCLLVLPSGELVVGGSYSVVGGDEEVFNIGRLDPNTGVWHAFGESTNGGVNAVAYIPASNELIVGGLFSLAGGVSVNNIARLNMTTGIWSALGSGVTGGGGSVRAITAIAGNSIIVGGDFTTAGGQSRQRVARFNLSTNSWSTLPTGADNSVYSLTTLSDGDVVLGGAFANAGNVPASRLARYYPGPQNPVILGQPLAVNSSVGGSALFGVTASVTTGTGTPTYRWRKNGTDMNTTTYPSAATAVLSLTNLQNSDVAQYDCRVTNACGGLSTLSSGAGLTLSGGGGGCEADFNSDGVVDFFDYLDFVQQFSVGC